MTQENIAGRVSEPEFDGRAAIPATVESFAFNSWKRS